VSNSIRAKHYGVASIAQRARKSRRSREAAFLIRNLNADMLFSSPVTVGNALSVKSGAAQPGLEISPRVTSPTRRTRP